MSETAAPPALSPQIKRWRLILGKDTEKCLSTMQGGAGVLDANERIMDEALAAIYDNTPGEAGASKRSAGLGPSYPTIAKWLTDIRRLFPQEMVSVIQQDAMERKGLKQLLLEPEALAELKPDISIVSTLMALKDQIPNKSKEQARALVKALVDEIIRLIEHDLKRAVVGALNRKQHTPIPSLPNTDWKTTIRRNLKNYDPGTKRIIPEKFYFFEKRRPSKEWNIILDMDQSGSMADSIIYASIMGSIFASMPALETRIVAFDTQVVDLTEKCGSDPVDILFGVQLGGGTDINKSVRYCAQFIANPKKTLFILISDLYEGGVEAGLIRQLGDLKESGVTVLVLLALCDDGTPSYDQKLAAKIASLGIPSFGCTPNKLPELIAAALKGDDLMALATTISFSASK
ncbi:VWA domain-containing protein [Breznakiellaceae bacterium SP9]